MPLLDTIKDGITRIIPQKKHSTLPSTSMGLTGGIGNGHGMVEDDMIISKPAIVFHASQLFFHFLAMACFASVAAFQAKWNVGPSGLTGFTLFVTIAGILLSSFMLAIPVMYEKHDRFVRLARALKEVRVGFILIGTGTTMSLLIAFIVTISAWTQPGCKNPDNDPSANDERGDDFKNGLEGWCNTKKAAGIFLWLAFGFWAASLTVLIIDWRQGKLLGPRDPPFHPPAQQMEAAYEEEDDDYEHVRPPRGRQETSESSLPDTTTAAAAANPFADNNRYSGASSNGYSTGYGASPYTAPSSTAYSGTPSRPSMDAYGAFSDPTPSGYGGGSTRPPVLPEHNFGGSSPGEQPRISRTMQYADPYSAVSASLGGAPQGQPTPPSYESYQGYR